LEAGIDLSTHALGFRARRFVAVVESGEITHVYDEEGTEFTKKTAVSKILEELR
jgi:peroxiredoxin